MIDTMLSWLSPHLGDGERLMLIPLEESAPIVVPVALLALVGLAFATRKWWRRQFRALWAKVNPPRLDAEERQRLTATEERLARLLSMVDNPRAVKSQVLETLTVYRKCLHRRGQLRRYLAAGNEDLELTLVDLEKKLDESTESASDSRRRGAVEAAQRAARNRLRNRARAMRELETVEMELLELEHRLWAVAENHIVKSAGVRAHDEVSELLERLTAEEATGREIEDLEDWRA